jgi:hypothetical protein
MLALQRSACKVAKGASAYIAAPGSLHIQQQIHADTACRYMQI